jgi:pantothenate kinase
MALSGSRHLLGIAGGPGSGKSTLASLIAGSLSPELCLVVPMDGFHLDNEILVADGTRDRKGAPFTFDGAGYVAMLRRLFDQRAGETVYAPRYDRARSLSIAGAIAVPGTVPLVITEGNYLLLADEPWAQIRSLLDAAWYVDVPDDVRVSRLVARHVESGKTLEAATEWVMRSDEPNAALVAASAHRASDTVDLASSHFEP